MEILRPSRLRYLLAFAILSLAILAVSDSAKAAPAKGPTYKLDLDRHLSPGMVVGGEVHALSRFYTGPADHPTSVLAKHFFEGRASYVLTVDSVTSSGNPFDAHIRLDSFTVSLRPGDPPLTASCSGSVIQRIGVTKNFARTDGSALDPTEVKVLGKMFEPIFSASASQANELYGNPKPVHVGENWNGNSTVIARDLAIGMGLSIDPKQIDSWAKLNGKVTTNGIECLDISTKAAVRGMPMPSLGNMTTSKTATAEAETRSLYPLNTALPRLDMRYDVTCHFALVENGQSVQINFEQLEEATPFIVYKQ
jgi:hypothetical protein